MTAEAFFKELKRLIELDPKPPTHIVGCEGCEYADHVFHSKNLLYCFDDVNCSDSIYLYDCVNVANSMDCEYSIESELCYESVEAHKCFNCNYIENCSNMTDSSYSYACMNCQDVFGCVRLRNKSFCIFNRQLTEAEYKEKVKQYQSWPPEKVLAVVEELTRKYPQTQINEGFNENTTYGNYMYYNKNCYLCFTASHCKDSGYIHESNYQNTCFDIHYSTRNELCYEVIDSGDSFNCNYLVYSGNCQDSSYVINCSDVKNSLGVVGKAHMQYVILNRQFNKEDYERISKEILDDIKKKQLGWEDVTYY